MTRILLAVLAAAAIAAPALAAELHHGPDRMRGPVGSNHMGAHHHPIHCTIRHHHRICH